MYSRRQLCKITAQLSKLYDCPKLQEKYWNAIRVRDTETLDFFAKFGSDVRHQVMNANTYNHGLLFGFKAFTFDEHGWLQHQEWNKEEVIEFRTPKDKAISNEIRLAEGLNRKWTYSISYHFGGAGGGSNPSVFDRPYSTREEALAHAIEKFIGEFEHAFKRNEEFPDPTNFKIPYMRAVLKLIEDLKRKTHSYQTSLF